MKDFRKNKRKGLEKLTLTRYIENKRRRKISTSNLPDQFEQMNRGKSGPFR